MKSRLPHGLMLAPLLLAAAAPAPLGNDISRQLAAARSQLQHSIISVAASDQATDMDFLFRLGMMEGHLIVGHELLAAQEEALALPHFGHPVRELYDDLTDYVNAKKFPPFDTQLLKLESTVAAAPYDAATEAQYQAVIDTIHRARDTAPAELRASVPSMIKVCSETLDAASGEYNGSLEDGQVKQLIEYHDSRGYVSWVAQSINGLIASHADRPSQDLLGRMKTVVEKAQWIVEPLLPAPAPRASVDQYRAVVSEATALSK